MEREFLRKILNKEDYGIIGYRAHPDMKMPSIEIISEIMENIRALIFPGYFCRETPWTIKWEDEISQKAEFVEKNMEEQIFRALCFQCNIRKNAKCDHCESLAEEITKKFLEELPKVKKVIYTDIKAMYEFDPAAKSVDEVILCYPGAKAISYYRVAHILHKLDVPVIPRIMM